LATLIVLAGTNGAGKSSLAGVALRTRGGDYFNPDECTRQILAQHPTYAHDQANSLAWQANVELLEEAIKHQRNYAFETTLGGRTIPRLIGEAAAAGIAVRLWYVGLDSAERHLQRIAARVAAGGHDIPESKVRERYKASLENLVMLMPCLTELRVFDNSAETPLATSVTAEPKLVLHVVTRRVAFPMTVDDIRATPEWAKPLIAKAFEERS